MPTKSNISQKALANLVRNIDARRRFPANLFVGSWSGFHFFDADWIFDAQFVDGAKELLVTEGGQCACIADLDAPLGVVRSSFILDKAITCDDYQSFLNGSGVGDGWLHGVGRFGCTSDLGEWCIYCERAAEIAVVALRDRNAAEKYSATIARFKSLPIDQAVAKPLSYGFSERALSADWRAELLKQYAATR